MAKAQSTAAGDGSGARGAGSTEPAHWVFPWVQLHGVHLHALTHQQCLEFILRQIRVGRGGWVVTPNVDILRKLTVDRCFAQLCDEADLRLADGMPLIWASRLQGTPLPERVAGSDLISSLSAAAQASDLSVFLVGGAPGAADAAARVLRERHPTLKIDAFCPGPNFEFDAPTMQAIIRRLEELQPHLVFVGLGAPKQELLICHLRPHAPGSWFLGVGISFSFLCGQVQRAPAWMQRAGLEWVHRLWQEPRRLGRRYLVDGLPFAAQLLLLAAWRRFTHRHTLQGSTLL